MTILLVGGIGKMGDAYRAAAASEGVMLLHAETKLPSTPPRVDAVLVVVGVCSHPLLTAARQLAALQRAPIHYLRTASLSTLRRTLEEVCHAPV